MAKQRQRQPNAWERFMLWIDANQKVFWVVLLAALSFTFAFPQVAQVWNPRTGDRVLYEVFGERFTKSHFDAIERELQAVLTLAGGAYASRTRTESLVFPRADDSGYRVDIAPLQFHVYLKEAQRLGLRISDAELGEWRRRIWREYTAIIRAREQLEARGTDLTSQNARWEFFQLQQEIAKELETSGAFDVQGWAQMVREAMARMPRGDVRLTPIAFEEALRDVLLVSLLDEYVKASVNVSLDDVYDLYSKRLQRRALSWLPVEPTDDLREKVAASITSEDVEHHFDANREGFFRSLSIACDYLLIPREHFEAQVEASITDQDIEDSYLAGRNRYLKPYIPPDEGEFRLRTAEEQQARDAMIYRPLTEVRDQVRKALIDERTDRDLRDFAREVKKRLYPTAEADGTTAQASTFEDLQKEHPFLRVAKVQASTQEQAEEAFGEAYIRSVVDSWYRTAEQEMDLSETQRSALQNHQILPDGKGYVYFRDVRVIDPHRSAFKEMEGRVRESLERERLAEILSSALEAELKAVNSGEKKLEDLVGQTLEVEVAEGVSSTVRTGEIESSRFVGGIFPGTSAAYGPEIRVPAPESDGEKEKASGEEDPQEDLVTHPSDRVLRETAFAIETRGAVAFAGDKEEGLCYLVRFDDTVKPDPAEFDRYRSGLERELLAEKERTYFRDWKRDVEVRAYGRSLETTGEAEPDAGGAAETTAG
ncbi:MAG: hypothetical protein JXA90_02570 [Planctomycetes bacterium]|nr:hypothetical protein [Planctomycetota bacterium]